MELGSPEHKSLLLKSIIKSSLRIVSMGLFIGILLMIPMIFRENTFSSGLFYAGIALMMGSSFYALLLGFKKYQKIIKPFHQQYSHNQNPNKDSD